MIPSNIDLAHEWVADYANASVAGQGGDDALFAAACSLVNGFDLGEGDAMAALMAYNAKKCSPPWAEHRLKHKLAQARAARHEHPPGGLARWMLKQKGLLTPSAGGSRREESGVAPEPQAEAEKFPYDYEKLRRRERRDWGVVNDAWFMSKSPIAVDNIGPLEFCEHVFGHDKRVLVFTTFESQGQFLIWTGTGDRPTRSFRLGREEGIKAVESKLPRGGRDGVWYLCNPVDGQWYPNPRAALKNGIVPLSRRSQESVTDWPHLVLECDHKEKACPCKACQGRDNPRIHELWLNFLAQLRLPIVAIYSSGGKSVHALVRVNAATKEEWDRMKQVIQGVAILHGADRGALSAVRLTRLPGCMRGDREQRLLYLNPSPSEDGTPIGLGGNVCV